MVQETHQQILRDAARRRRGDFLLAAGAAALAAAAVAATGVISIGAAVAVVVAVSASLALIFVTRARAEPPAQLRSALTETMAAKEQELRALGLLRGVVSAIPEPIIVINAEGRVELANAAARAFIGADEAEGRLLSSVLRTPEVLTAVADVGEGLPEHAVDFSPPGAVERNWRAVVSLMPSTTDDRRVLVILRDLTAERRLERMRGDFIANASHELRTPLSSLIGFIETLRGHAKDDPAARDRFLEIMQSQAERMGRLVFDLMSLSRIELNEHVEPTGEVDLAAATTDVVEALTPLADGSHSRIDVRSDVGGGAIVAGDRDEIIQVIQNLADNAIKYGPDGGVVRVRVGHGMPPPFEGLPDADGETSDQPAANRTGDAVGQIAAREGLSIQDYYYVQVRDFGEGIDRSALPRLTERFYRVDVERSRERGGTGLGLAIVKHIVNRHQGGLQIESAVGQGSAFTAFFRAVRKDDETASAPRETADA